jgi:hypothetical protein
MEIKEIGWEAIDSIYLAQVKAKWLILLSTIMNLLFCVSRGISSLAERLMASQD